MSKAKGRGSGGVFQPSYKNKQGERVLSPTWYIYFNRRGRQIKENSHSARESDAWRLLRKRLGEVEAGKPVAADVNRTTFNDLMQMAQDDYIANGLSSLRDLQNSIGHLRKFFGEDRAIQITSDRITAYVADRQQHDKAAAATINKELCALSKGFTLALRAGKAAAKPYIKLLELNNTRKGFLEPEQFQAVLQHLPEPLKPVLITAYCTGWRVHDEILTRQKKHLDLSAGWLRLDPGETKNREGRNFPLATLPWLQETLQRQSEWTVKFEKAQGVIVPWLFHREGKRIKYFRRAWLTACIQAGYGRVVLDVVHGKPVKKVADFIPHDFRRTAVRNLERARVPRSAAMAMVGHRTESIYRRYAIADESMLEDAGAKLAQLYADHNRKELEVSK